MIGSQEPRIKIEPQYFDSYGDDAADLMACYATPLDDWQKLVLKCWLGIDSSDNFITVNAGLSVPRQNGKNVIIEAREFYGLIVLGERIIHTAHQVKTSKKSFRRLASIFTDKRYPEITDQVKTIRYTNGEEAIELINGGIIEYSARSRQAARGFDGVSLVVFDEAQELTDDQIEALMATLAASSTGRRQIIYAGTPPYPGCPGEVFKRRRTTCLNNPGKHDSWHEWSVKADSIDKINLYDKNLWFMCNPGLGIRLTVEFTHEELTTMSPDGFARERLGWWVEEIKEKGVITAIDQEKFLNCESKEKKPDGKTAFGIKFTADGSEVCLCGACIGPDGKIRISLIERAPVAAGLNWLSNFLKPRYETASCVVIDGKNGVDVLIDKISDVWKMKDSVIVTNKATVIAAASMLIDQIIDGNLTWYFEQEDLKNSALTALKRPIAGGFGFGGENSAPIEAASFALWGAKTSKRNPGRKMRIG